MILIYYKTKLFSPLYFLTVWGLGRMCLLDVAVPDMHISPFLKLNVKLVKENNNISVLGLAGPEPLLQSMYCMIRARI
jgi:hypothetical protein